jgi:hypothetical protein
MKTDIVHYTTDYESILLSPKNRTVNVNSQKYRDIKESVKAHGQLVPAIVDVLDGKLHLAEGQHRLDIAKELGTGFSYVIRKGSLALIRELNARRINWTTHDYIQSNKNDNLAYRYFDTLLEVSGLPVPALHIALFGERISMDEFRTGGMNLTFHQMNDFRATVLPKLLRIINVNEHEFRNKLVGAKAVGVLTDMIRHPEYDHEHFVARISNATKMKSMTTREDAEAFLLGLYNKRLAAKKQITLNGGN